MPFAAWPAALFLLVVVTAAAAVCRGDSNSSAGVNTSVWETPWEDGGIVPVGRLPYVASISPVGNNQHICSGVLVDPLYVLTLSKCVEEHSVFSAGKRPLVHLGLTLVGSKEQVEKETFVVEKTFVHEEVALLKLNRRSRKPHPRIHSDETSLRDGNQDLVAVGWGSKMVELGQDIFGHLRIETTHYFSANVCNMPTLMNGKVAQEHFCGFNSQQYASCVVDSGAPVLLPHRTDDFLEEGGIHTLDFLVGINFGGEVCGKVAKPDVYVDVGLLEPWIKDTIRKESARLAQKTAGLEGHVNNDSGGITKDDLLKLFNTIQEQATWPGSMQGSAYILGPVLATICVMCITMFQVCGHKPSGAGRGPEVVSNVVGHPSPDERGTSVPATRVPDVTPALDPHWKHNSTPVERPVDASGSMKLERMVHAPPKSGVSPPVIRSPFEDHKKKMERLNKIKAFPFFNLDMEVSQKVVQMYVNQSLGYGGSSTVFPGMLFDSDIGRERKVAVKKMNSSKLTAELRIAKVVCRDKHPNIVQILGASVDKPEAPEGQDAIIEGYMVMEQMSHNLQSALDDPGVMLGLSRGQAIDVLMGVASGLMHLHQQDVVHRDVKPGNVLLALAITNGGVSVEVQAVKLNDFDLSGLCRDNQVSLRFCGTQGYMAPELMGQDEGPKVDGKALDMFAFGKVICEVLGGSKVPLLKCCSKEWSAHLQDIADLAARCTSQDPTQRPSAAEAFKELNSVKSSPWFSSGHLSHKLTDLIHLMHSGSNCSRAFGDYSSYGGLTYRECFKLLVAVARELHNQRSAVAELTADVDLGNCLFLEKVAKDDGSHDYRAVFTPPEPAAAVLPKRGGSFRKLAARMRAHKDNTSALVKLMDDLFVATEDEERLLRKDALLPPELADLMEAVSTGRNGHTYTSVADQLQAALDGGGCWLIKRAVPCRRPNSASGSGSL